MGYDLVINTAQLQSRATEVDTCTTTIESARNTIAGTQNQISWNALSLIFAPYAIAARFGIKSLSAMTRDISETEHHLAVYLRQTAAEMTTIGGGRVKDTKETLGDLQEPVTGTGTGPGDGDGGGGGFDGGGGITGGDGGATSGAAFLTPPGGDGSSDDDKDEGEKRGDDLVFLLSGNGKVFVTDDELCAFLEKQREEESDDLKTFYECQKGDQVKTLERYVEAHPGEDISEIKPPVKQNQ